MFQHTSDLAHIARINKANTMLATFLFTRTMNSLPQISPELARLHVLVVDEDDAARAACVEVATSLGYEAEGVSRLDRVRSILLQFPTDIILIDLPKNGDSGLETVAEINALYPRVAIIAMAPVNSASVALSAVHCGASDYLNKPFTVDELASSLERAGRQTQIDTQARQLRERLRLHEGMG